MLADAVLSPRPATRAATRPAPRAATRCPPSPPAAVLARLLDDNIAALDGYPVRPLINDWLNALRSGADTGEAGEVLRFVLRHWTRQLDHELAELAEGSGESVGQVRQQVCDTRRALGRLMAELAPWQAAAAEPAQAPAGPATSPCRMLAR